MDRALSTAIVGAIVNVVLSTIVPCLLKDSQNRKGSIITEMKLTFMVNRHLLITSSLITAIAVYLGMLIFFFIVANEEILPTILHHSEFVAWVYKTLFSRARCHCESFVRADLLCLVTSLAVVRFPAGFFFKVVLYIY